MKYFSQICLPAIPNNLASELITYCRSVKMSEDKRKWLQNFHDCVDIIAFEEYGTLNTAISLDMQNSLRKIYQEYFPDEKLQFVLGKIEAVPNTISVTPPHCDRGRFTACNFILQAGGSEVETVFFNKKRTDDNISTALNIKKNLLVEKSKVIFKNNKWYVFNAQQAHGVKNITNSRFILSIVFDSNIKYKDFLVKYKNLLGVAPYGGL